MILTGRFTPQPFRDATTALRLNLAAIGLAPDLYHAWRDAYARAAPDWIDLSKDTRDIWIAHATGVLIGLEHPATRPKEM